MNYTKALVIGGYPLTNAERACILEDQNPHETCYIAVDGGLTQYMLMDILPDIFLGDMDSVRESALFWYFNKRSASILFKKDKDFLDMEAAVDYMAGLSIESAEIWGVIGGRADQTFSCIPILKRADKNGIELSLRTADERIGMLTGPFESNIQCKKGDSWSFIAISTVVEGLTLEGFAYGLRNKTINDDETLALSNISKSNQVNIKIEKGTVMYFNKTGRHKNVE